MATLNAIIKKRNESNTGWDSILPITTGENVLLGADGTTASEEIDKIKRKFDYVTTGFDTLQDMKANANKLKVGDIVQTYGYSTLNDGGGAVYEIVSAQSGYCETVATGVYAKLIHGKEFKPEQFGCVGDTDCSVAFNKMISYIESTLPIYDFGKPETTNCLDWRGVNLIFTNQYYVSNEIKFGHAVFLILDNLKLKAIGTFPTGKAMLNFHGVNRNFVISNCVFDGDYKAEVCVQVSDYTMGSCVSDTYIGQFRRRGFNAINNGYEVKFSNVKVEQSTWEKESILATLPEGVGIYTSGGQQDYKFDNVIINYCKDYGMLLNGSVNFLNNTHVFGCGVNLSARSNVVSNCYFDRTVEIGGYFIMSDCYFAFTEDIPVIKSTETVANGWNYGYAKIMNCSFRSSVPVTTFFDGIVKSEYPLMIGNSFQNVQQVVNRGPASVYGDAYYPLVQNRYTDTVDVKVVNFGELVMMYGNGTGAKTFTFPIAFQTIIGYGATVVSGNESANASISNNSSIYVGSGVEYNWFVIGTIKI